MIKSKGQTWLVSLCISFFFAVAAVCIGNGLRGERKAFADVGPYNTAQSVSASGANVTAGSDQSGSVTHKGLLIEPERTTGSYSGTLNAILPANSKIEFTFPGTAANADGQSKQLDFTFRFTSVATEEWFEIYTVMINNNWWNSMMVRDMEGHTRTTWKWGGGWFETARDDGFMYPQYGGSSLTAGYFNTTYTDGVFSIDVLSSEKNVTLAKFDCDAYASIDNPNLVCGLKKIDFSQGYTVSFSSNSSNGVATAPLLIEKINDQSFETAVWESEPDWYTAYAEIPIISISDEIISEYTSDEPLKVPSATYVYPLKETSAAAVAKIEIQKDGGEWQTVSAGEIISAAGNYVLRYTAVEGGSAVRNTTEKSFVVYRDYFDLADTVTLSGANVTASADKSGNVGHKGILIEPLKPMLSYGGEINGVFSGNAKLDFNFPGTKNDNGSARQIDFTFRFTDVNDSSNFFDVIVFNDGWSGWFNAMAVRDKYGHIRTTRYNDGKIFDKATSSDEDAALNNLPYYGGSDELSGYIDLQWNGEVLEIYALNASGVRYCLAKFDSSSYTDIDADNGVYGLQKIAFADGYKISFVSQSKNSEKTAPLLLEKINDIPLTDKFLAPEYMTYDSMEYIGGGDRVEITATRNAVADEDLGAGALFRYTVALGTLTLKGEKNVYPEGLDLAQIGENTFTYLFLDQSVNQAVVTLDTPPFIALNGIADEVGYRKGGQNASEYQILKSDVTAVDLLDGSVGADKISIYLKVPGAVEFIEISEGSFFPESLGVYEVKYVAYDNAGLSSEIVRKIRVIDGEVPAITINGTLPEEVLVGSSLILPSATATDGGQSVQDIKVNVYLGQKLIEAVNGKIVFEEAGIYRIVYMAVDTDGNESKTEYFINVKADNEKPVLPQVGLPDKIKLGTEISIPVVNADDNADGRVNVSVKVFYGIEEIEISSGKFTPDKEGVYTVVYTAKDNAGNTGESIYEITVLKNIIESGPTSTAGSVNVTAIILVCFGAAAVVVVGLVVAIVIKKRRNK